MRFPLLVEALLMLTLVFPLTAEARSLPDAERQKIEALIAHVAEMKDASFVRNGRSYDAAVAATFLREKWRANEAQVTSAREFIENIASFSSTSGTPYLIRFKEGSEITIREYLMAELNRIETQARDPVPPQL
jgi:hypothetical protein